MSYRYLEHTSDIEFLAEGSTLEEVFESSAKAFYDSIVDIDKVSPLEKRKISVGGVDLENLLYNFLEELLYLFDTEMLVGREIKVDISKKEGEYSLNAEIRGEILDLKKHEPKTEIKAVTYHEMYVKRVGDKYIAHVILDI
ncbi:MAG: archease [Candidatus Aenigmarchaeota archaeon]|nr:archease [Candidatus Aenigmarchaeota archaeon]